VNPGIDSVADEVELEEVYATERHLFYVACTRARDRLLVSGVAPGSEFLKDLDAWLESGRLPDRRAGVSARPKRC